MAGKSGVISSNEQLNTYLMKTKNLMKTKIEVLLLFAVLLFASCRRAITFSANGIVVYAPNNTVEVKTITQTRENNNIPLVEIISDGKIHEVESEIAMTAGYGLYYPDMDYNFYLTATDTTEYYILQQNFSVNKTYITAVNAFEKYGADVIIQAFKTQAPEYITCITSKETQTIKGSFFQWFYDIDLTIEE